MSSQKHTPASNTLRSSCYFTLLPCVKTLFSPDVQRHANHTAGKPFKKEEKDAENKIVRVVQNLAKIKTKRQPPSALNKQTASQTSVDTFSCRDPSKFKYIEAVIDSEQTKNIGRIIGRAFKKL